MGVISLYDTRNFPVLFLIRKGSLKELSKRKVIKPRMEPEICFFTILDNIRYIVVEYVLILVNASEDEGRVFPD